jgi:hypothetical protein
MEEDGAGVGCENGAGEAEEDGFGDGEVFEGVWRPGHKSMAGKRKRTCKTRYERNLQ